MKQILALPEECFQLDRQAGRPLAGVSYLGERRRAVLLEELNDRRLEHGIRFRRWGWPLRHRRRRGRLGGLALFWLRGGCGRWRGALQEGLDANFVVVGGLGEHEVRVEALVVAVAVVGLDQPRRPVPGARQLRRRPHLVLRVRV